MSGVCVGECFVSVIMLRSSFSLLLYSQGALTRYEVLRLKKAQPFGPSHLSGAARCLDDLPITCRAAQEGRLVYNCDAAFRCSPVGAGFILLVVLRAKEKRFRQPCFTSCDVTFTRIFSQTTFLGPI